MNDKENVKQFLMKHKLQNYGYDYKFFKKMSDHKAKLKAKLRQMDEAQVRKNLAFAGILGRGRRLSHSPVKKRTPSGKWKKTGKKEWDYTTGQSFNEELINMLQIGSGNKKSFWQTQDDWNTEIYRSMYN